MPGKGPAPQLQFKGSGPKAKLISDPMVPVDSRDLEGWRKTHGKGPKHKLEKFWGQAADGSQGWIIIQPDGQEVALLPSLDQARAALVEARGRLKWVAPTMSYPGWTAKDVLGRWWMVEPYDPNTITPRRAKELKIIPRFPLFNEKSILSPEANEAKSRRILTGLGYHKGPFAEEVDP